MIKEYTCTSCGYYKEFKLKEKTPTPCPECGSKSCRIVFRDGTKIKSRQCNIDSQMVENPRWSWSMGINVDKIPEMKKRFPDREYHPKTGQLLVKSRHHKKKLMKEHGMVEYETKR